MPLTHLARDEDELVTATEDATVPELARLMRDETVGSVIIEGQDKPGVIMTERGHADRPVNRNQTANRSVS